MQSREQIYTTQVYGRLNSQYNGSPSPEYKSLALRFPAILLKTGLTHSMGYLANNQVVGHAYLQDVVVIMRHATITGMTMPADSTICEFTRTLNQEQYIYVTQEVLVVSTWIKHFCS